MPILPLNMMRAQTGDIEEEVPEIIVEEPAIVKRTSSSGKVSRGVTILDSDELWQEAMASPLVMIDYQAKWCGPCKRIAPIIDKMPNEFPTVSFYKLDIDDMDYIATEENIQCMPTFKFYRNGVVDKKLTVTGANVDKVRANLKDFTA